MQEPVITVILPSLNVKKYIRECMDSVVNQSLKELEILCIDAGSTDGTLEILGEYVQSDGRVKIIHSDIKSYGAQVNRGIALAKGKYIAVLETDDFIDPSMYEKLYDIAEANILDFAKSDFKGFRTLNNGQRLYDEGRTWENDELYERILSVEEFPELYLRDVNIWKGIYNKNFLTKNNIFLNETLGAAFQDIGFCHLFLYYAKRGIYIKDMLYYYRRDSEGSSSNKPYGLRFAYQEYKRLLEWDIYGGNDTIFYHYLYVRMAMVFIGEYEKLLSYDQKSFQEYCEINEWFKKRLKKRIDQEEITEADMGTCIWEELLLLMKDEDSFRLKWNFNHELKMERERLLIDKIGQEQVVIFGCGIYSRKCLILCNKCNIRITAFSDNNRNLWGQRYCGYYVCRPSELKIRYGNTKIIISSKKYEKDIKEQLLEMGICEECIICLSYYS